MIFYLIPVDALFIVRPIITILITAIFYIILRIIKNEKFKKRKILSNLCFLILSIVMFILIGRFASLALYKSIIVGLLFSAVLYLVISLKSRFVIFISISLLLLFLSKYNKLDKIITPSHSTGFLTFGFNDDIQYYDSSMDYIGKKNLSKIYDDLYWGFDKVFPLRGRIFYPKNEGIYPIVFIIHGNALAETDSHKGYDYILNFLADNGFIGVSVDQNFLNGDWTNLGNGQPRENDVRGKHLLKCVDYILNLNSDSQSPLYNIINTENVNLIGHSRGGEAVAIAASLSSNINKVIAIAPSYNQYKGKVEMADSSYLLLQGANDGDLRYFQGLSTYNKINLTNNSFKSAILVDGFNHVQFNSDWGKYDGKGPGKIFFKTGNILDSKHQREFTKIVILDFLSNNSFYEKIIKHKNDSNITFHYNYIDHTFKALLNMNTLEDMNKIQVENLTTSYVHSYKNYNLKLDWNSNRAKLIYPIKDDLYIDELILQFHNNQDEKKVIKITLLPSNIEKKIILEKEITFDYFWNNFFYDNRSEDLMFQTYKIPVKEKVNGIKLEFEDDQGSIYFDDILFTSHQKIE